MVTKNERLYGKKPRNTAGDGGVLAPPQPKNKDKRKTKECSQLTKQEVPKTMILGCLFCKRVFLGNKAWSRCIDHMWSKHEDDILASRMAYPINYSKPEGYIP